MRRSLTIAPRLPQPVCNCFLCSGAKTESTWGTDPLVSPQHVSTQAQRNAPTFRKRETICSRMSRLLGRDKAKSTNTSWRDEDEKSDAGQETCGLRKICRIFRRSRRQRSQDQSKHLDPAQTRETSDGIATLDRKARRERSTPLNLNPVWAASDLSLPSTRPSSLEVNYSLQEEVSSIVAPPPSQHQQSDSSEGQAVQDEQPDLPDPVIRSPPSPPSSTAVSPIGCTYEEWCQDTAPSRARSPEELPSIPLRSSSRAAPWRSRSLLAMASLQAKPSYASMSTVMSWNPFHLPGPSRTSFSDLFDIFRRCGSREGMYSPAQASNESSTSLLRDDSSASLVAENASDPSPQSAILQAINERRGTTPTFKYTQPVGSSSRSFDSRASTPTFKYTQPMDNSSRPFDSRTPTPTFKYTQPADNSSRSFESRATTPTSKYTQPVVVIHPPNPFGIPPKPPGTPTRSLRKFVRAKPCPDPQKVSQTNPKLSWTNSEFQFSSSRPPLAPRSGNSIPFHSLNSIGYSTSDLTTTGSDSRWSEPSTEDTNTTAQSAPLDAPKRLAESSWTSSMTSEDDDSHLTAIDNVIARNMPDWDRFEQVKPKYPPQIVEPRVPTPPVGGARWVGFGRRLSTAVEEDEGEGEGEEELIGREGKPRPIEMIREGAWWRAENDTGRIVGELPERYHGLRNGEWKAKKKEYHYGNLACV